jgi:ribonuclease HII
MDINFIAGVDEAGRGPVIGPMVLACTIFEAEVLDYLKCLGVKDSKLLSPKKREFFYRQILDECCWLSVKVLWPDVIDHYVNEKSLNRLESETIGKIIELIDLPCIMYVDSPQTPEIFRKMIYSSCTKTSKVDVTCSFKADQLYPSVSCASIVAKVVRDDIIEKLKIDYGDFGSGYPSDSKTRSYVSASGSDCNIIRKSWKTYREQTLNL